MLAIVEMKDREELVDDLDVNLLFCMICHCADSTRAFSVADKNKDKPSLHAIIFHSRPRAKQLKYLTIIHKKSVSWY